MVADLSSVRCIEDSVLLTAKDIDYSNNYSWKPTHFFNVADGFSVWGRIEKTGYVTLTVTNAFGCVAQDSLLFEPDACCAVYFPSAFTPNGDGKNDLFRPIYNGYHQFHVFRINNRWGQTVFESTNSDLAWDGKYNGEPQDMDVYYYYVKYDCDGKTIVQSGDVTLVR